MSGINLSRIKKIHFIGIKGVAMSGVAVICQEKGLEVRGSDVEKEFITDKILLQKGVKFYSGFHPKNLEWNPDAVVVGASWGEENIEVQEALQRRLPVLTESELRGLLSREKKTIVVSGVHGKSTTTSLLAYIFSLAGLKPCYLVGTASIPDLGGNSHWDKGDYFIVEGDEYIRSKTDHKPKFLDLDPDTAIVTSLEWEHVDVYRDVKDIENAFGRLMKKTKNRVVACMDWPSIVKVSEPFGRKVTTYGYSVEADWQVYDFLQKLHYSHFKVKKGHRLFDEFELNLMGRYNALNALSCIIVSELYGIDMAAVKEGLSTFSGLERRMNISHRGEITIIDDYGHHPTEVFETLHAIRDTYMKRNIVCIFQPHTASRTLAFLQEFGQAFKDVDTVVLVDIFASARESNVPVDTQDLLSVLKKHHPHVLYFGGIEDTARGVLPLLRRRDVVVTMGAGDVYKIKKLLFSS